jgi:RHS repeat-associated protein
LSGATTRTFAYDNAGNVTSSAGITYTYDGRGRMKQAGTVTYGINGLGQRVRKSSGSDTYFAYDEAGHLIGEYDSTGAAIEETVWLGDTPVAVVKPASPFTVFYIWTDQLNSPRQISDTSNVSRWEWANNDPFGSNVLNENPGGVGPFTYNLRFPGQYFDAESGLNYNYFRDYDPVIGRYMESDPIGLGAGFNTYAYVDSNPLLVIDHLGLAQSRFDCIANCIRKERFDLDETLASLALTLGIGKMPKTANEMRGFGPRDQLNPITNQASRAQGRGYWPGGRAFGRSALGGFLGAAATLATVGEGFYDIGAIGRCIYVCIDNKCSY